MKVVNNNIQTELNHACVTADYIKDHLKTHQTMRKELGLLIVTTTLAFWGIVIAVVYMLS